MKFFYVLYCSILYPLIRLFCPCRVYGKDKIPEGAIIVCSNHSSYYDSVMLAIYFGFNKNKLIFMAKAELLKKPFLGAILRSVGTFPVHRDEKTDIQAIRTAIKHLKNGKKIVMFPEGTRVEQGEYVAAKTGAVRIASKLKVGILPVWLTPGNKAFSRSAMVIGDPYYIKQPKDKNFEPIAEELLDKIRKLEPAN